MHTTQRERREGSEKGIIYAKKNSMDMGWKVLGGNRDGLADDDDDEDVQGRRRKGEDEGRRMIRKREKGDKGERGLDWSGTP